MLPATTSQIDFKEIRLVTTTGRIVRPFDPQPDMFCLEDIAHSLGFQCRFGGHTSKFYSVAEHSIIMSSLPEIPNELRLTALLHDAGEAYVQDIIRPIKYCFPKYRSLEDQLMKVIAKVFHLPWPFPKSIKSADQTLLAEEMRQLLPKNELHHLTKPPRHDIEFYCWDPLSAKKNFLKKYTQLNEERNREPSKNLANC